MTQPTTACRDSFRPVTATADRRGPCLWPTPDLPRLEGTYTVTDKYDVQLLYNGSPLNGVDTDHQELDLFIPSAATRELHSARDAIKWDF
jgi:hypothetical protein